MAIADKITLSSTKVLTAKSVDEIDALLVEMKQLFEKNSLYSADVSIRWDRVPGKDMTETHSIKFKSLQEFSILVGTIRRNEENYINYTFSATIKLKLEKKDKLAELALKEKELDFFQEDFMPDGENISKITLTHKVDGVDVKSVMIS